MLSSLRLKVKYNIIHGKTMNCIFGVDHTSTAASRLRAQKLRRQMPVPLCQLDASVAGEKLKRIGRQAGLDSSGNRRVAQVVNLKFDKVDFEDEMAGEREEC